MYVLTTPMTFLKFIQGSGPDGYFFRHYRKWTIFKKHIHDELNQWVYPSSEGMVYINKFSEMFEEQKFKL